jgi:hypothetical protein
MQWPLLIRPTKAISVKAHTALRVFSLVCFVAAPGASLGDTPGDAPRRQTNILRNSVCAFPAIASGQVCASVGDKRG